MLNILSRGHVQYDGPRVPNKHIVYRIMVLLIAGVLASGCSVFRKEKEDEAESVEQLYEIAKQQMSKKNWQSALETLRTLEAKYSYGVYAEQAQLDTVYIYYRSEQRGLAIAAADRFIKLHPTHKAVDYAYYLKGLASFSENKSLFGALTGRDDLSDRDATAIRNAMVAFKELYTLFPDSQYAPDARIRAGYLLEALARNETAVANYYYTRKAYVAVVNRAKGVIENYSTTLAVEQALALLMFGYKNMGFDDLAGDARRVLALNFPQSGYLNQTTDTVKFFNKYSPKSDKPKQQKKGWFSSLFNWSKTDKPSS